MGAEVSAETVEATAGVSFELDGAWADLGELATESERTVLLTLAQAGLGEVPELGVEDATSGIPLDIAWPDAKVAIVVEPLEAAELSDLTEGGWHVLMANDDGLVAALACAGIE